MLDALLGSLARVKLLNLFLMNPQQAHEAATLARELKISPQTIRKELISLRDFGLLKEQVGAIEIIRADQAPKKSKASPATQAPKIYFKVNESFLLYPEIKALFLKAQILFSQNFILGLRQIAQPKVLALTGFFTNYPEAQTDILIVGSVRRPAFNKLLNSLEKDLGREINYTILSEKEFFYRQSVMDIFLYNILTGKTLFLINDLPPRERV